MNMPITEEKQTYRIDIKKLKYVNVIMLEKDERGQILPVPKFETEEDLFAFGDVLNVPVSRFKFEDMTGGLYGVTYIIGGTKDEIRAIAADTDKVYTNLLKKNLKQCLSEKDYKKCFEDSIIEDVPATINTMMFDYFSPDKSRVIHVLGIFTQEHEQIIRDTIKDANKIININLDYMRRVEVFYRDLNNNLKTVFLLFAQKEEDIIDKLNLQYYLNFELNLKNKSCKEIVLVFPDVGNMFATVYQYLPYNNIPEEIMTKAMYEAALKTLEHIELRNS